MSRLTTPTFVIGLGGIGNLVIRLIHERYISSQRGVPDTVRLRSIDTAPQLANDVAAPCRQRCLRKPEIQCERRNRIPVTLSESQEMVEVWKVFSPLDSSKMEPERKRPVGRLVFFERFQRFHDALKADLEGPKHVEVQRRLQEQGLGRLSMTPRVFIVGSLAGGTASGTCIDTAFLVRHLLAQLGYDSGGATITAILGLPSVIHVVSNDENTDMGQQRKVNTAAALAELDFLMRGWNDGEVQLDYPGPVGAFSPRAPLFDQVYLFTNRKLHGNVFSQQRDILQRTAHFIFGQIALGAGEQTLAVLDNYKAKFNPAEQQVADGLIAIYGSFGVEWLEVPHDVLMREWCGRIGDDIGQRVRDFDWSREPRQNRERIVWQAFGQDYQPLQTAFEVINATPEAVGAVKGLPDVQAFLGQVQDATNKKDLATALQAFDAQLPGLRDPLRRLARRLPASNQDGAWARSFAADLLRQSAFRAGGARRMLETATGAAPAPVCFTVGVTGKPRYGPAALQSLVWLSSRRWASTDLGEGSHRPAGTNTCPLRNRTPCGRTCADVRAFGGDGRSTPAVCAAAGPRTWDHPSRSVVAATTRCLAAGRT